MQVYVGNLSRHITDAEFLALALPFGEPDSVVVARKADGRGEGYGLLEYTNADDARAALAGLHGMTIDGQILNARATIGE